MRGDYPEVRMTEAVIRSGHPPLILHTRPALEMDDRQFFEFCRLNRDWRIERTDEGDLEIMPPAGGETSSRNAIITAQMVGWALRDGTGIVTDSSGGFILPSGAVRSPDAAWVRRERLMALTAEQKQRFLPLCPDFVVELRSPSDSLAVLREKLAQYMENGARLGWLIDPESKQVHVHRPETDVQRLDETSELSGEPELPGFVLDLRAIWSPGF